MFTNFNLERLMKFIFYISLITGIMACANRTETKISGSLEFKVPFITDIKIENRYHPDLDSMNRSYIQVSGIFGFDRDTITLEAPEIFISSSSQNNNVEGVDTSFGYSGLRIYIEENLVLDSIPGWRARKHARIPAFIINESNRTQSFSAKDDFCDAILEAKDSTGEWRPIEYSTRVFDFCGNGSYTVKLQPRKYLVVSFPAYEGSFVTSLRLKCRLNNKILYSNEFSGKINYGQFMLPKSSYEYQQMKEDSSFSSFLFIEPT